MLLLCVCVKLMVYAGSKWSSKKTRVTRELEYQHECYALGPRNGTEQFRGLFSGVTVKAGLWTLDWTVDWNMDCLKDACS